MTGAGPHRRAVVGVDGCRGRWLVVRRGPPDPDGHRDTSADLVDDLGPLVAELRAGELAAMAIDMPIALLDHHPRACDVAARRLIGPRRASVFPAPVRAVLDAVDYDDARRRSREAAGVAPSRQAFNLVPAIRHLDALVRPEDQDRLVEAHPEAAFARLAGEGLPHPKSTAEGRALRRHLLLGADPSLAALLDRAGSGPGPRLPEIDLLDATALTLTADRVEAGVERRCGDERDHRGRRAEIVW